MAGLRAKNLVRSIREGRRDHMLSVLEADGRKTVREAASQRNALIAAEAPLVGSTKQASRPYPDAPDEPATLTIKQLWEHMVAYEWVTERRHGETVCTFTEFAKLWTEEQP